MILLDHQPLNLNIPQTEVDRAVKATLEEIKKSNKVFTLKDPNPTRKTDRGRKVSNPAVQFRLNTGEAVTWTYKDEAGELHEYTGVWAQCDKTPRLNREGVYDYEASLVRILEEQSYNCAKSSEKIFFIRDIYNPLRVGIKVEDKEKEVEDKNKSRMLRSTVEFMIFGEGKLSAEELVKLAYSRGINADNMSLPVVKDELFNHMERSEKNKIDTNYGYEDFIRDANNMGRDIEILSQIQKAIERNLIIAKQEKGWIYANNVLICVIPLNKWDNKNNVLLNKFMSDPDSYNVFLETTGLGKAVTAEIEVSTIPDQPEEAPQPIQVPIEKTEAEKKKEMIKYIKAKYDRFFPPKTRLETLEKYIAEKEKELVS